MAPKKIGPYPNPGTRELGLGCRRGLGDAAKVMILKWGYPGLSDWTLDPLTSVLRRDTEERREEGKGPDHVKLEAETEVMWPQAAEVPKTGSHKGSSLPWEPTCTLISDIWPLELWQSKFKNYLPFISNLCKGFLWWSRKTALPLQGTQVLSLVRELRSCISHSEAKIIITMYVIN